MHSDDGLDEISLAAPTRVAELHGGAIREYGISPQDFGLSLSRDGVHGGDAATNAAIAGAILAGEPGPARDVVLANAAAALYVAGAADSLRNGAEMAAESIDSGKAREKLEAMRKFEGRSQNSEVKGS